MNSRDDKQPCVNPVMPELSESVLEVTLTAVRERHRRQQKRNRGMVAIAALAVAVGSVWLTRDAVSPEDSSTVSQAMEEASEPAEPRIVKFSTVERGPLSTRVVRTSERSPQVVLIDDERLLELCGTVGGGLVTLADNRRIAVVASGTVNDDLPTGWQP